MTIAKQFVAPNLPLPPDVYNRGQQDEINRALRLYFNLLDNYLANTILDALNGGVGGNGITLPHIAASDAGPQYADGDDTPTLVTWDTLTSGYLWTLNSPGSATAAVAGVYTIRYSLQFANTANAIHDAVVWLKINGADAADSATYFTVPARKSATDFGYLVGYSSVTFEIQAGDEIKLYWATSQAYNPVGPINGVYIDHIPAQTVPYARPANPSTVGSITFVSALP